MDNYITKHLQESMETKQAILQNSEFLGKIQLIADKCIQAVASGNKILICGNGGSASDAQHFAGEICGRFFLERKGYACVCLNTDTSIMTAVANDYGYDAVFSRQVEALAKAGDILITISTSGNSVNCLRAMETAKEIGATNYVLTGKTGGTMAEIADCSLIVPSKDTPSIQESHITIIHILCYLIEKGLVEDGK